MKKNLSDEIERKFIDTIDVDDWEIETDTGWEDVSSISKTIPYEVWRIETENGLILGAADDHIVFDHNFNQVFIKDLIPNESRIITKNGEEIVTKVENLRYLEEMYDISVDSPNHRYYSNNILSHNSTTTLAFFLWSVLFNDEYAVAILANKGSLARELLGRLQKAYEHIPKWLQQGIVSWNKGSIELENGSKVFAYATSASGVRGGTFNALLLDEFAFVPRNIAHDFFQSTYPVISSGKNTKVIIVSTPFGLNHFYKMWMDAVEGRSTYVPVEIAWDQVPGRDEEWKKETIRNIGEEAFRVEFESVSGDTLINVDGEEITIGELYDELDDGFNNNHKIESPEGFVHFYGINKISKDSYIHLKFSNGKELKCSTDHPLKTINGTIKAKYIDKKTEVLTKNGGCFVVSKRHIKKKIDLYDVINSGTEHLYYTNGIVSHNCEFLGSSNTLISGNKLKELSSIRPILSEDGLDVYEHPREGRIYIAVVDTSEGVGLNYSTISVIDVSEAPYKQVAKYRDNTITPMLFPNTIYSIGRKYNDAFVLIELNNVGHQVADILHYDLEYENIFKIEYTSRKGSAVSAGFKRGTTLGLKTTKVVKKIGCANLKTLIEDNKLIINDLDTIEELYNFVRVNETYKADVGFNDDLVMGLVLFSWLVTQEYFKNSTDIDIRRILVEEKNMMIEEGEPLDGIFLSGLEDDFIYVDNDIWKLE